MERIARRRQHAGVDYIVHPFFGINFGTGEVTRTTAPWEAFARDMNLAGRMARDAGLKLGYHNHNWEFFRLTDDPSRTAYDVLTARPIRTSCTWSWTCSGPFGARATQWTSSSRTRRRIQQYHVKDMNQAGSFDRPRPGPPRLPGDLRSTPRRPARSSTSSSATTPAPHRGARRRPEHGRGRLRLPRCVRF